MLGTHQEGTECERAFSVASLFSWRRRQSVLAVNLRSSNIELDADNDLEPL